MPTLTCDAFASIADLLEIVCGDLASPADDELMQGALDDATDILVKVSGYRFYGLCTFTVRPCRECSYGTWCGCCDLDMVPLPDDIVSITSVKIDGVLVDASTYAIVNGPTGPGLIKVAAGDRPTSWPACQKLWRRTTEEDTFEIIYTAGQTISIVEKQANLELAISIIQSQPNRNVLAVRGATRVAGGGVTIDRDAAGDDLTDQATSLPAVAQFRAKWNPYGDRVFSAGWSPELQRG